MSFHNIRFPEDIAYGSSGGPSYDTEVVAMASGHEQRNINWSAARARYNVAHGVKTPAQLEALIAFFRARKGRAYGFRFKDWSDYAAAAQLIGTGNGGTTAFQLVKTYESGGVVESRVITRPVAESVRLYFNDVAQASGWSVDDESGVVSFASAPAGGVSITADFEFDVPVRFDTDRLSARLDDYGVHSWNDIALVEVRDGA
jgi:uncharacterized protein (TIGR02217 family)